MTNTPVNPGSDDVVASRALPHACGRCHAHWAGSSTAHCGADCHHTFTSPRSFDKHRFDGECRPPATVGLVAIERVGYTAWGFPIDDDARARLAATRTGVAT